MQNNILASMVNKGADGPTSVFLAGTTEGNHAGLLIAFGIVLIIAGIFCFVRRKK